MSLVISTGRNAQPAARAGTVVAVRTTRRRRRRPRPPRPLPPQFGPRRTRNRQNRRNPSMATAAIPAAYTHVRSNKQPMMQSIKAGISIAHSEILGLVPAGVSFDERTAMIPANFQWLNPVASAYSRYRWTKLEIYIVPAVGTNRDGAYAIGLGYDPLDAPPGDYTFAMIAAMEGSVVQTVYAPPTTPATLDCSAGRRNLNWYNYISRASFDVLDIGDTGIYTQGWMHLISSSSGDALPVGGHILVNYQIELIDAISETDNIPPALTAISRHRKTALVKPPVDLAGLLESMVLRSVGGGLAPPDNSRTEDMEEEEVATV
jgi:hypothetical protein